MKLFLNGGGSGKQTLKTYQEINKIIDHNKPVLYIPLAMDESVHSYDSCFEWIKGEISLIDVSNIEIVKTFEELYERDFNKYSMIYIGGGNTYKLLKGIKESNSFDKFIDYINNDGIIYGSSAGSVIFGKSINSIEIMDDNNVSLKDTRGFNLLNGMSLFVHYTNYKSKYTEDENRNLTEGYTNFLKNYSNENEVVIAYPEENTIYINNENIKMIGDKPYYIFEKGKKRMDENLF